MMTRWASIGLAAALAVLVPTIPLAAGQARAAEDGLRRIGAHVEIDDANMPGLLAGGAEVLVKGHSSGRVVLFGADVQEDAEVADSLYVLAADTHLTGAVMGDAEILSGRLSVTSSIDGRLTAVGARIDVAKGAKIGGATSLTGSKVAFAGEAIGPLVIEASSADFAGTAKGPVRIEAPHVHIADAAVADGDIEIYTISEPQIDAGAKIGGHINRHSLSEVSAARALESAGPVAHIIPGLFLLGSALMAGLMFLWLGRGGAEGAIDELIDSPASSGLWGLVALVLLPIAAVVLGLTIIGAPVGALALLALPLLLLLGYACAGLGLGEWFFNRLGEPRSAGLRALHLLAGLIGLGLLGLIPLAGPVLLAIATLCGFGALLRTLHDRMRGVGAT